MASSLAPCPRAANGAPGPCGAKRRRPHNISACYRCSTPSSPLDSRSGKKSKTRGFVSLMPRKEAAAPKTGRVRVLDKGVDRKDFHLRYGEEVVLSRGCVARSCTFTGDGTVRLDDESIALECTFGPGITIEAPDGEMHDCTFQADKGKYGGTTTIKGAAIIEGAGLDDGARMRFTGTSPRLTLASGANDARIEFTGKGVMDVIADEHEPLNNSTLIADTPERGRQRGFRVGGTFQNCSMNPVCEAAYPHSRTRQGRGPSPRFRECTVTALCCSGDSAINLENSVFDDSEICISSDHDNRDDVILGEVNGCLLEIGDVSSLSADRIYQSEIRDTAFINTRVSVPFIESDFVNCTFQDSNMQLSEFRRCRAVNSCDNGGNILMSREGQEISGLSVEGDYGDRFDTELPY